MAYKEFTKRTRGAPDPAFEKGKKGAFIREKILTYLSLNKTATAQELADVCNLDYVYNLYPYLSPLVIGEKIVKIPTHYALKKGE